MRRSTFKILFYLERDNLAKKNGKAAIMARITIDGEIAQFSAKQEILPELWNNVVGKAMGSTADSRMINHNLI